MRLWNCLFSTTLSLMFAVSGTSAEVRLISSSEVSISGQITQGDAVEVSQIFLSRDVDHVRLSGSGGSLKDGLLMGLLFREFGVHTEVAKECYSACALAFLGGVRRSIASGASLGFHAPYLPEFPANISPKGILYLGERLAAEVFFYLKNLGLSNEFARQVFQYSGDEMWILSAEDIARYGIAGLSSRQIPANVRNLYMIWDGFTQPVLGSIAFSEGRIDADIMLPGGDTHCSGGEIMVEEFVEWEVECNNGLKASGRSISLGRGHGSIGVGKDNHGRIIRLIVGGLEN